MGNTGDKLRWLRQQRGWSQAQVAKMLHVGRTTYLKYESGELNPASKIKKLSEMYGVTSDFLLELPSADELRESASEYAPPILDKLLEQPQIRFEKHLYTLSDDDREKMRMALRLALWDAKKKMNDNDGNQ